MSDHRIERLEIVVSKEHAEIRVWVEGHDQPTLPLDLFKKVSGVFQNSMNAVARNNKKRGVWIMADVQGESDCNWRMASRLVDVPNGGAP
ncbi:MAG: hypothetical protein IT477_10730 [Rhodanobacteraceae bacterium]|nr:hypothetical protein [Rhodanobacteraceae bacterium]